MLAEILGLDADFGPNVAAYWERLKQRDGYKRACAVQEKALKEMKGPAGVSV